MGCGSGKLLEEQEITMEDQTREGRMGITEEDVQRKARRQSTSVKKVPNGRQNGVLTDEDSSTCTEVESSDEDDSEHSVIFRRKSMVEKLELPVSDSEDNGSTYGNNNEPQQNGKPLENDALDVMQKQKVQNNRLEGIEKMEGANASFMRRTNSLRASCSFKSEDIRDLDADDSAEDMDTVNPLPRNPWDARQLNSRGNSGKSTASQSAVGVGFVTESPHSRSTPGSKMARAGAFLAWEARHDSFGSLENVSDVTFRNDSQLLVSQDSEHKKGIQVYDVNQSGVPGPVLGSAWVGATRGVCNNPCDANVIALTDPVYKSVKFLNGIGDGLGGWKNDIFKMPGSIAVNSEGKYIVSDVMGREKAINLFTPQGKLIKSFGIGFFDWPWYLAIDSHDRIIVSEQSSSTIVIFDKNGKFLTNFSKHGKGEGKLNMPNGVTVDNMDNILVADSNNYRISMFSSDGLFIKNILSHLNYKPMSLSCNENGQLAIVSDKSVHLYQTFQQKSFLL